MRTRANDPARIENFISKVKHVLDQHVYSVIRIDNLVSSGCGTYAADNVELERIKRIKTACYGKVGRKFKSLGVFSSKPKKESIVNALRHAVKVADQHNAGIKAAIDPSRMPRGAVDVSVLRAILNGLLGMKLSDARMPVFDDSEE